MAEPRTEVERDFNAAIAELRGLHRGHTKDGAPVTADEAIWKAFAIVLSHAFLARAEVDLLRVEFEKSLGRHAKLADVVADVAAVAREVAQKCGDGTSGASLRVSYVPERGVPTTLPPAHVVVPAKAAA